MSTAIVVTSATGWVEVDDRLVNVLIPGGGHKLQGQCRRREYDHLGRLVCATPWEPTGIEMVWQSAPKKPLWLRIWRWLFKWR